MLILIALHALAAAAAWLTSPRLGRRCWMVAATAPAATVGWAVWHTPAVLGGSRQTTRVSWVDQLGLALDLRLDGLGLLMVYVVAVVGVTILIYAARYTESDREAGRLTAGLTGFAGAMLGIVLADNLFLLWGFWELTTLLSYLLIAFHPTEEGARPAAHKALVVNAGGGLAMLAGLALLADATGTASLSVILEAGPGGVDAGMALILVGILVKSAQVPFHAWLPAAMVAPTPVSAYLHAAAMVKAGPYLLIRLSPVAVGIQWWGPLVIALGLAGAVFGGYRAMRVADLKELLAYTTIAELGLIFVFGAVGSAEATAAALLLLAAHAAFKGCLFMATGVVDHEVGSRTVGAIEGLGTRLPVVAAVAGLAVASMAGLPPFLGYTGEDEGFKALTAAPLGGWTAPVLAGVAVATILKASFSTRLVLAALPSGRRPPPPKHRPGLWWNGPPAALAAAGLVLGLFSGSVGHLIQSALPRTQEQELEIGLWHGLTPALGLTLLTLLLGVAAAVYQAGWERLGAVTSRLWWDASAWRRLQRSPERAGHWLSSFGGRQANLVLVVTGSIVAAALAIVAYDGDPALDVPTNRAVAVVAALVVVASIGVVMARRRLVAVLLLSATGYGVALLYLAMDAPDLTFTQLLVETLLLVVLLTVAWRLSPQTAPVPPARRRLRLLTAFVAGVALTAAVGLTYEASLENPVSEFYRSRLHVGVEISNIVTAILVDFRGLDTLGELTVLVSASIGILALYPVLDRGRPILTEQRTSVLAVAVDVLYPAVLLFGVYLFFAGHATVGGGFPAGLVAGVALVLRHAAHEPGILRKERVVPARLAGAGVFMAAAAALWSRLAGEAVLQNLDLSFHLPGIGEVAASSSLLFEAGLATAVVGLAYTVLTRLERTGT